MTDWLDNKSPAPPSDDLAVLRRVLRRDYLTRADMKYALKDIAAMAQEAVAARVALVAVVDGDDDDEARAADGPARWRAHTASGEILQHQQIALRASVALLEHVQRTETLIATTGADSLPVTSASIAAHQVAGVVAAPIFRWSRAGDERRLAAILYVDRSAQQPPFSPAQAELVQDLAEIASRNLNLLWQLDRAEEEVAKKSAALDDIMQQHAAAWSFGDWQTRDAAFAQKVIEPLERVAAFDRVQLLITGDTGTGKTTLARAFHGRGPRKNGPFVVLDCAQVTSSETLAAELFGYAKNAGYQNAPPQGRPGKAELADGGTLFIDEVATLPIDLQQRLLALIQDGTFSRLGESKTRRVDLQIIAATNEDIPARIAEGKFREDLYWRLNLLHVELPPLDQRPADIPGLAQKLLDKARARHGRDDVAAFTDDALRALCAHPWRRAGNIRGLERNIERAVLLAPAGAPHIDVDTLQLTPPAAPGSATAGRRSSAPGSDPIRAAILEHKSARAAAAALGISYGKLIWHLRKEGLGVRDVLRDG